jgi:hypothetical protein
MIFMKFKIMNRGFDTLDDCFVSSGRTRISGLHG